MESLEQEITRKLIEALDLDLDPGEVDLERPIFGEQGLGLDSVDALEIAAMLQMDFGVEIPNRETANRVLGSIRAMADFVREQCAARGGA